MTEQTEVEPGYYWVKLGHNRPEIARHDGYFWFVCGDAQHWQHHAVDVLSARLVMRPELRVIDGCQTSQDC